MYTLIHRGPHRETFSLVSNLSLVSTMFCCFNELDDNETFIPQVIVKLFTCESVSLLLSSLQGRRMLVH